MGENKIMKFIEKLNKPAWLVIGIVFGAITILGVRFATYKTPKEVHYHANFAVYVNGQREMFSNPLIYEEITSCQAKTGATMTPSERAHLHDKINDVVHVEDNAVTWGNFFQNIGWNISDRYLDTSGKLLTESDTNKITYMLNGEIINNPTSREINSKDKLLVSYGSSTESDIQKQYNSVPTSAEKYNTAKDPASCSAGHDDSGLKARFTHML